MSDGQQPIWYYLQAGQRFGPVPLQHLQALVAAGVVKPTDQVWRAPMPGWVTVESLKHLLMPPEAAIQAKQPPPLPVAEVATPAPSVVSAPIAQAESPTPVERTKRDAEAVQIIARQQYIKKRVGEIGSIFGRLFSAPSTASAAPPTAKEIERLGEELKSLTAEGKKLEQRLGELGVSPAELAQWANPTNEAVALTASDPSDTSKHFQAPAAATNLGIAPSLVVSPALFVRGRKHADLIKRAIEWVESKQQRISGPAIGGMPPEVHRLTMMEAVARVVPILAPHHGWFSRDESKESTEPIDLFDADVIADYIFGIDMAHTVPIGVTWPQLGDPATEFPHALADDAMFYGGGPDPAKVDASDPTNPRLRAGANATMNRRMQAQIANLGGRESLTNPSTVIWEMAGQLGLRRAKNWEQLARKFSLDYTAYYLPQIILANMRAKLQAHQPEIVYESEALRIELLPTSRCCIKIRDVDDQGDTVTFILSMFAPSPEIGSGGRFVYDAYDAQGEWVEQKCLIEMPPVFVGREVNATIRFQTRKTKGEFLRVLI